MRALIGLLAVSLAACHNHPFSPHCEDHSGLPYCETYEVDTCSDLAVTVDPPIGDVPISTDARFTGSASAGGRGVVGVRVAGEEATVTPEGAWTVTVPWERLASLAPDCDTDTDPNVEVVLDIDVRTSCTPAVWSRVPLDACTGDACTSVAACDDGTE